MALVMLVTDAAKSWYAGERVHRYADAYRLYQFAVAGDMRLSCIFSEFDALVAYERTYQKGSTVKSMEQRGDIVVVDR